MHEGPSRPSVHLSFYPRETNAGFEDFHTIILTSTQRLKPL